MAYTQLTRYQVAKIKAILMHKTDCGIAISRVAERYGVSYGAIYSIYRGDTWPNVRPYQYLNMRDLDGLCYNRSRGKYQKHYDKRKGA